jgi:hypothetical protein
LLAQQPTAMAPSSSEDDDFAAVFLLLSPSHIPLTTAIIAQIKLWDFFSFAELQCRYRRIPQCALVDTHESSFQRLYNSHNNQAFITFTGLDFVSFQYLLAKFEPLYFSYSPYSVNGKIVRMREHVVTKGRPHPLGPADCLGLVLGYTRTRGSLYALQMVFGASHSVYVCF